MKLRNFGLFTLFLYMTLLSVHSLEATDLPDTVYLHDGWTFGPPAKPARFPATVPGVVQQDFIRLGVLPDPGWGTNEDSVQWAGEHDWTYRLVFKLTDEQLKSRNSILEFQGLDTYAEVKLNGREILRSENMFVGHRVPVQGLLQKENELLVAFTSPLKAALPAYEKSGVDYPADNDHGHPRLSVYTRKAPYHYGWDWGERLITIGIWRPVLLHLQGDLAFEEQPEVTCRLNPLACDKAEVAVNVTLRNNTSRTKKIQIGCTLFAPDGHIVHQSRKPVACRGVVSDYSIAFDVHRPELWMPAGWGKPNLYRAEVVLYDEKGKPLGLKAEATAGFRTVELVREPDAYGRSFYFRVNGKPLFAKGANYIPGTLLLPARDEAYRRRLFDDIKDQGINMLRVWGGGVYEDDWFYNRADSLGILIWQDFMFACTAYPGDTAFLDNVEQEVRYNVRRLRRHPSVAVWCGNNEIREGLKYWGWQKKYSPEVYSRFLTDYDKLFARLIPSLLKEEDPNRSYIQSSPDTANWGRPQTLGLGESHYWGVWYGREPFEILRERTSRFMSEFGVQSFPALSSIRRFSTRADEALDSPVMKAHQKSSIGNEVIAEYIDRYYTPTSDFARFVYLSQVMQGAGIRLGIEAQRAAAPFCMGSLYWQFNDAWPAVSWSAIDYYGQRKALYYEARRAFRPVILVPAADGAGIRIVNDRLVSMEDLTLSVTPVRFDGSKPQQKEWQCAVSVRANSVSDACSIPLEKLLPEAEKTRMLLLYQLKDRKGTVLADYLYYARSPKDLALPQDPGLTFTTQSTERGELKVKVKAWQLVRSLYLEVSECFGRWSDNYFDLLPGEERILLFTPDEQLPQQIRLLHQHL